MADSHRPAGYLARQYAESLTGFGEPLELPLSGGWLSARPVPDSNYRDAMSCYPLFCCRDWARVGEDLRALEGRLASVTLVTDPLADDRVPALEPHFDFLRPFKEHYVARLDVPVEKFASAHHRYYARRALRRVEVDICTQPAPHLDEWSSLYGELVVRHKLRGIKAFSPEAFARQLATPGAVLLRALLNGRAVAAQLWFEQGFERDRAAYYHLSAANPEGYEIRAPYALVWTAAKYFAGRTGWLALGAGAGLAEASSGLTEFKKGWATATRQAYLCGRVLHRGWYDELVRQKAAGSETYFPAYRAGELS